jgi:serine/threonine-protein kinase
VPDLRGRTLDDARSALQAVGLAATFRGVNVNVDKNVVAETMPAAGTSLGPGSTVTVLVGTGSTPVPDVSGMNQSEATRALQANSFGVAITTARDPRVPAGSAIGTRPSAGTIIQRGSVVELIISSGR